MRSRLGSSFVPHSLLTELAHEWFAGLTYAPSDSSVVAAALENGASGDADVDPLLYRLEDLLGQIARRAAVQLSTRTTARMRLASRLVSLALVRAR